MSTPLEVTQVAYDETHEVVVTLSPVQHRQLLGDFARAVAATRSAGASNFALLLQAGRPGNDLRRMDALTRLVDRLGLQPCSWTLTLEQAEALSADLDEAAEEPPSCDCGRFIPKPSDLTTPDGCEQCAPRRIGIEP